MDLETFAKVGRGDIVRHRQEGGSMLVHHADGRRITAVSAVEVSNVVDWRFQNSGAINGLASLKPAMRIRRNNGGPLYAVTWNYDQVVLAVRTVVIQSSQADEWVLTHKAVLVPQRSD